MVGDFELQLSCNFVPLFMFSSSSRLWPNDIADLPRTSKILFVGYFVRELVEMKINTNEGTKRFGARLEFLLRKLRFTRVSGFERSSWEFLVNSIG